MISGICQTLWVCCRPKNAHPLPHLLVCLLLADPQVVNPYTGDAYAQAPPLPEPVKDMTWE